MKSAPTGRCGSRASGSDCQGMSSQAPSTQPASFIAKGVAHIGIDRVGEPLMVTFILLAKFTMLAF